MLCFFSPFSLSPFYRDDTNCRDKSTEIQNHRQRTQSEKTIHRYNKGSSLSSLSPLSLSLTLSLSHTLSIFSPLANRYYISFSISLSLSLLITGEVEMIRREMNTPEAKAMANRMIKGSLFSGGQLCSITRTHIQTHILTFIVCINCLMCPSSISFHLSLSGQGGGRLQEEIEMDNEQFIQAQLHQNKEMEKEQEKYLDEIAVHVGTIGQRSPALHPRPLFPSSLHTNVFFFSLSLSFLPLL